MECVFRVKLAASKDGQKLVVTDVVDRHENHTPDEASFVHLPRQRKLDAQTRDEAVAMLGMKSNKKLLQNHIAEKNGTIVILKDLHNLANPKQPKTAAVSDPRDFSALMAEMKNIPGAVIDILATDEGTLQGIFFQTESMQATYASYPELVLLDATYKLNDLRMVLFVMMVEDGNGESEIVSMWIVANEERQTIKSMMELFKKNNPSWEKTVCVMADKDMVERDVITEQWPQADILICLFHCLRSFRTQITTEKMFISNDQRMQVLEIIQKMAVSSCEDVYQDAYNELKSLQVSTVMEYFNTNWHGIRAQWVEGLKTNSVNYLNSTNNRLECINQKIKTVVTKYSTMPQFFRDLMKCVKSLSIERDHRAVRIFQKVAITPYPRDSPLYRYNGLVTPFAMTYIIQQLKHSNSVRIPEIPTGTDTIEIETSGGKITVGYDICGCGFFKAMSLPCRHILAFRKKCGLDLFHANLCNVRWTRLYYKSNQRVFLQSPATSSDTSHTSFGVIPSPSGTRRILSQHEKYRKAHVITQKVASRVSEFPTRQYDYVISCLNKMIAVWDEGGQIVVSEANEMDDEVEEMVVEVSEMPLTTSAGVSTENHEEASEMPLTTSAEDMTYQDFLAPGVSSTEHPSEMDADEVIIQAVVDAETLPVNSSDHHYALTGMDANVTSNSNVVDPDSDFITTSTPSAIGISTIKMPTRVPKKGRPKGAEMTTIGLPSRARSRTKQMTFLKKTSQEKEKTMLSWVLEDTSVQEALGGKKIGKADLAVKEVPMKCLDENVNMDRISRFFSSHGWREVQAMLARARDDGSWICIICRRDLAGVTIGCDGCLDWSHLTCLGLKAPPKTKNWFCARCRLTIAN